MPIKRPPVSLSGAATGVSAATAAAGAPAPAARVASTPTKGAVASAVPRSNTTGASSFASVIDSIAASLADPTCKAFAAPAALSAAAPAGTKSLVEAAHDAVDARVACVYALGLIMCALGGESFSRKFPDAGSGGAGGLCAQLRPHGALLARAAARLAAALAEAAPAQPRGAAITAAKQLSQAGDALVSVCDAMERLELAASFEPAIAVLEGAGGRLVQGQALGKWLRGVWRPALARWHGLRAPVDALVRDDSDSRTIDAAVAKVRREVEQHSTVFEPLVLPFGRVGPVEVLVTQRLVPHAKSAAEGARKKQQARDAIRKAIKELDLVALAGATKALEKALGVGSTATRDSSALTAAKPVLPASGGKLVAGPGSGPSVASPSRAADLGLLEEARQVRADIHSVAAMTSAVTTVLGRGDASLREISGTLRGVLELVLRLQAYKDEAQTRAALAVVSAAGPSRLDASVNRPATAAVAPSVAPVQPRPRTSAAAPAAQPPSAVKPPAAVIEPTSVTAPGISDDRAVWNAMSQALRGAAGNPVDEAALCNAISVASVPLTARPWPVDAVALHARLTRCVCRELQRVGGLVRATQLLQRFRQREAGGTAAASEPNLPHRLTKGAMNAAHPSNANRTRGASAVRAPSASAATRASTAAVGDAASATSSNGQPTGVLSPTEVAEVKHAILLASGTGSPAEVDTSFGAVRVPPPRPVSTRQGATGAVGARVASTSGPVGLVDQDVRDLQALLRRQTQRTIKVHYECNLRLVVVDDISDFASVMVAVCAAVGVTDRVAAARGPLRLRYQDSDGDFITTGHQAEWTIALQEHALAGTGTLSSNTGSTETADEGKLRRIELYADHQPIAGPPRAGGDIALPAGGASPVVRALRPRGVLGRALQEKAANIRGVPGAAVPARSDSSHHSSPLRTPAAVGVAPPPPPPPLPPQSAWLAPDQRLELCTVASATTVAPSLRETQPPVPVAVARRPGVAADEASAKVGGWNFSHGQRLELQTVASMSTSADPSTARPRVGVAARPVPVRPTTQQQGLRPDAVGRAGLVTPAPSPARGHNPWAGVAKRPSHAATASGGSAAAAPKFVVQGAGVV